MKYLEAFLAENQSGTDIHRIVPAKPAKAPSDGFAGATSRDIQAASQPVASQDEVDAILAVWRRTVGLALDRDRVRGHCASLKQWNTKIGGR